MHSRFAGLILTLVLAAGGAVGAPKAEHVGSYVWRIDDANFGGWSGLDFTDEGAHFRAVSDAGYTLTGTMIRDAAGAVTGVTAGSIMLMRGDEAEPLAPDVRDAEGLAVAPDGSYFVSFERVHRVAGYQDDAARAKLISYKRLDLTMYPFNQGLEALAMSADGTLYAIPEVDPAGGYAHPVYTYLDGQWSVPFSLPEDGFWRPVGADFGPDGKLYVLERDLWGLVGFMTRVRRLTLTDGKIAGDEVVLTTRAGAFQNLEGLGVWQDAEGAIRLTMVSDDNYMFPMFTEIVDFRVTE